MVFEETRLKGAFMVSLERREDDRGFFARAFCQQEFSAHGLEPVIAQANIGSSRLKGTVRGMHFQFPPHAEAKLMRATRGAVRDIIVDLRPESSTYLQHVAVTLSAHEHQALYVPKRFAHGYQTLEDETEICYHASEFFRPGSDGGLSPLDPRLGLDWPLPVVALSAKDASWTHLDQAEAEVRRRMTVRES